MILLERSDEAHPRGTEPEDHSKELLSLSYGKEYATEDLRADAEDFLSQREQSIQ